MGDGGERGKVVSLIARLNLEDRVELVPPNAVVDANRALATGEKPPTREGHSRCPSSRCYELSHGPAPGDVDCRYVDFLIFSSSSFSCSISFLRSFISFFNSSISGLGRA